MDCQARCKSPGPSRAAALKRPETNPCYCLSLAPGMDRFVALVHAHCTVAMLSANQVRGERQSREKRGEGKRLQSGCE